MRSVILAAAVVATTLLLPAPAEAGSVSKKASFALDQWFELDSTDGPVTLHRLRIERHQGGFTKSTLIRPGNDEFLETVQIELEFSNSATRDWEADLHVVWKDADGVVIDGYNGSEGLDSEESHDLTTVTLSTLKYGLKRAKTLEIEISYSPD